MQNIERHFRIWKGFDVLLAEKGTEPLLASQEEDAYVAGIQMDGYRGRRYANNKYMR